MFNSANIRPVKLSDLEKLKLVLDETGLFPSELLEEMITPFLSVADCDHIWKTYEHDGRPIALLFCEQERMTEGTWNVLALAVLPAFQSKGVGQLLMSAIEQTLKERGQSTLLVETSGLPEYERTRQFYDRIGYEHEAVIRDFYARDDDKIVFWKSLVE